MALPGDIPKTLAPTLSPVTEWQKGDPLTASRLTQHVQQTNKLIQTVSPGRQIVRGHSQGDASVKQFRIFSITAGDYLACHEWDGTTEGSDTIIIAKPWLLRKTPFDGETRGSISYLYTSAQKRIASKTGETNETQVVVMSYLDNDIIYAVRGVDGGTGAVDLAGGVITWLDLNVDGRMWAKMA